MGKHVYFWVGVFVAALIVPVITIGAWALATERALDMIAFAVGVMVTLALILVLTTIFRDRILTRITGTAETQLSEVMERAGKTIASAAMGDIEESTKQAAELGKVGISWYTWKSFYRWVIGTMIAILVVFAGFTGTVLLFEQTKRLGEQSVLLTEQTSLLVEQNKQFSRQNALTGLNLVSDLRNRLTNKPPLAKLNNVDFGTLEDGYNSCQLRLADQLDVAGPPNLSTIEAIKSLALSPELGSDVKDALVALLMDQNGVVSFGSLMILDEIGAVPDGKKVYVHKLLLEGALIKSNIDIVFVSSFITGFSCSNCNVRVDSSILSGPSVSGSISSVSSMILSDRFFLYHDKYSGFPSKSNIQLDEFNYSIVDNNYTLIGQGFDNIFIIGPHSNFEMLSGSFLSSEKGCDGLLEICNDNQFLSCTN